LLSPNATAAAAFNENVMIKFIDNTGDNVEDLVIKAIKRMIRCISSDHMLRNNWNI
jgi:hypothetical protein